MSGTAHAAAALPPPCRRLPERWQPQRLPGRRALPAQSGEVHARQVRPSGVAARRPSPAAQAGKGQATEPLPLARCCRSPTLLHFLVREVERVHGTAASLLEALPSCGAAAGLHLAALRRDVEELAAKAAG